MIKAERSSRPFDIESLRQDVRFGSKGDIAGVIGACPALHLKSDITGFYEYTSFCNGPVDVKRPLDRHVAELMLLSVVDAKAAT